jgi:hypothetical protein
MPYLCTYDEDSRIIRIKILDSSSGTGAGKTGLSNASTGLIISTIASPEATPTVYTVAGSTIETIATLGTYAAPTATKCRFKEVDATNHPGLYEIQLANARYAIAGQKGLVITISGAAGMVQADLHVLFTAFDLQDADPKVDIIDAPNATGLAAIADAILCRNFASVSGEAARSMLNALRFLRNKWSISSTTLIVTKEDDSTEAWHGTVTATPGADPVTANDPA